MSSGPYAASQRAGQRQLEAVGPAVEVEIAAVGTEVETEEWPPVWEPGWTGLPGLQEPWHLQMLNLDHCWPGHSAGAGLAHAVAS